MKPVAWITKSCKCYSTPLKSMEDSNNEELIPVYTAPRELSDEQKDEIIVEYMGEQHKGDYVLRHMIGAILKKASEK